MGGHNRSNLSQVKIAYITEGWDTDSAYDHTTNYRFTVPAGEGGKYFITAQWDGFTNQSNGGASSSSIYLYINGSASSTYSNYTDWRGSAGGGINRPNESISAIVNLSAADYVEVYGRIEVAGGGTWQTDNNHGWFAGYKLIGV